MSTRCTFALNDVRCSEPATHYCLRTLGDEAWTLETEPRQGQCLSNAYHHQWKHVPEFCQAHAEHVRFMRNAHALVEA